MTRSRLCVLVAGVQVALAIFLWWYAPLQFVRARQAVEAKYPNKHIQLSDDFFSRTLPAPAERISIALNFPAAVVAGPFNMAFSKPLYESDLRFLSVRDLVYFGSTGVLWYWVTSILIRRKTGSDLRNLPRLIRIGLLVFGVLFAMIVGALALDALVSKYSAPGSQQEGPFGLLWSVGLMAYFAWKLWSEFTSPERT